MGVIADKIRKAILGGEVRDNIAEGIEVVEQLREDYDRQVINAGNSNAEIVDARGNYTKLKERLDKEYEEVSAQLDTKANYKKTFQLSRVNVSNKVYSSPVATFIVDDGTSGFLSLVKPIFDSQSILGSIAIITDKVGTSGYMDLNELKELQKEGYSMLSHSKTHDQNIFKPGVATASDKEISNDYKKSFEWLCENGFNGADTIVYPWGGFEDSGRYKNLAREFYNNGVNASGTYNEDLNDNMYLNRTFINKNNSLDTYKELINNCKTNGGWLIFGIHANTNEIEATHLNEIITYLKAQGYTILPFIEANEIKGNAINIGDYTMNEKFFVSKRGKVAMTSTTPTSYEVENGENYSAIIKNVKKEGNIICANIKLENSSQTGTFTNSQVLCTIKNLRVPSQIISSCVITAGGVVSNSGLVIENTGATDIAIKCHGNLEYSNIRWINVNFSFIL